LLFSKGHFFYNIKPRYIKIAENYCRNKCQK
jgi:hypothetical protein